MSNRSQFSLKTKILYNRYNTNGGKIMKYFVFSDLHGSAKSFEAIQNAIQYHNVDTILCLGDILYHGPRNDLPEGYNPKQVIPNINQYKTNILAVRGNCEAEVDQMVLDFPVLATYSQLTLNNKRVFMTHGHIYNKDNLPPLNENDIFLQGHTHIPTATKENGIYLLNPGSCTLPKQNHPQTYAILDDTSFTIYTFDHKPYMQIKFD